MGSCLGEYRDDFAIPYLDDLLAYSGTFEDHLKHVRMVLQRLKKMALRLTLFMISGWGGGAKRLSTSFSPVTSTNVRISPKNFLTFSFNPFDRLV